MVVWIIGLSGAGKTTLALEITSQLRKKRSNVVMIDGDAIREVFANDLTYSLDDRRINAGRICRLVKMLSDQGLNVICSILSLFPESREWNRVNLSGYYEIFIDSPIENLIKRDNKEIYSNYFKGKVANVAGLDLEFIRPSNPDLTIQNTLSKEDLLKNAENIVNKVMWS